MSIPTKSAKAGAKPRGRAKASSRSTTVKASSLKASRTKSSATGKLQSKTGVRKAKVERARKLIDDPNYPNDEVMEAIAKKLARKWSK